MNTGWTMAVFLFAGLLGSVFLGCAAFSRRNRRGINKYALAASICSLTALCLIILGLNDPSKILRLLGAPFKGFSSAVIMQFAVVTTGVVACFKLRERFVTLSLLSIAVSLIAVISLARNYMLSSRPALDSVFFPAMLVALVTVTCVVVTYKNEKRYFTALAASVSAYIILFVCFTVRIAFVFPPDRVLIFSDIISGRLAPVFWGICVLTVVAPSVYFIAAYKRKSLKFSSVLCVFLILGIMLMSILINQLPLVEKGINNRLFF